MLQTLEKILQSQGFGSRRQCRQRILAAQVQVDGHPCSDPEQRFDPAGLTLTVQGESLPVLPQIYLALNKPAGHECSRHPSHHASVLSLLPFYLQARGVQPVGRLDQDTTGLLLLTDDGQWLQRMTHPRRHVPRRYRLETRLPLTTAQCEQLQQGVSLQGERGCFAAHDLQVLGPQEVAFSIHQGVYHQVKRMMAAVGNPLVRLHREQIGQLVLTDLQLAEGAWQYLSPAQQRLAQTGDT
jgi:16S rRNA pseudouridine516 synthase